MSPTDPSPPLRPGECRRLREDEWYAVLERVEPLHQWGSAFLVDEGGEDGCVRVYVRDVSGAGRHAVLRLEPLASARAREGVLRVEAASRQAADLVTAQQRGASLDELRLQEEASRRFVELAEALYRDLLAGARPLS